MTRYAAQSSGKIFIVVSQRPGSNDLTQDRHCQAMVDAIEAVA